MPTLLKGRYEIIETLGAGGFSETFLAVDTHLPSKRKCVIKHFKPKQQLDSATFKLVRERFEREAAVLESLSESCNQIPRLYASFIEEDEYYLVQELIEGETIKQKVVANGRFNEESIRQLLISILPVLNYVHSKGVIHRDIKPENIILRHRDALPVLIDFGAVKEIVTTVIDEYGTPVNPSIVIGTRGYMPPEQAEGKPVFASDLYGLAMTIIFAATCKEPQQLRDSTTGQIDLESEAVDLSAQLRTILNAAIQTDFRSRYATAQKMLTAIETMQGTNSPPPDKEKSVEAGQLVSIDRIKSLELEQQNLRNQIQVQSILQAFENRKQQEIIEEYKRATLQSVMIFNSAAIQIPFEVSAGYGLPYQSYSLFPKHYLIFNNVKYIRIQTQNGPTVEYSLEYGPRYKIFLNPQKRCWDLVRMPPEEVFS